MHRLQIELCNSNYNETNRFIYTNNAMCTISSLLSLTDNASNYLLSVSHQNCSQLITYALSYRGRHCAYFNSSKYCWKYTVNIEWIQQLPGVTKSYNIISVQSTKHFNHSPLKMDKSNQRTTLSQGFGVLVHQSKRQLMKFESSV